MKLIIRGIATLIATIFMITNVGAFTLENIYISDYAVGEGRLGKAEYVNNLNYALNTGYTGKGIRALVTNERLNDTKLRFAMDLEKACESDWVKIKDEVSKGTYDIVLFTQTEIGKDEIINMVQNASNTIFVIPMRYLTQNIVRDEDIATIKQEKNVVIIGEGMQNRGGEGKYDSYVDVFVEGYCNMDEAMLEIIALLLESNSVSKQDDVSEYLRKHSVRFSPKKEGTDSEDIYLLDCKMLFDNELNNSIIKDAYGFKNSELTGKSISISVITNLVTPSVSNQIVYLDEDAKKTSESEGKPYSEHDYEMLKQVVPDAKVTVYVCGNETEKTIMALKQAKSDIIILDFKINENCLPISDIKKELEKVTQKGTIVISPNSYEMNNYIKAADFYYLTYSDSEKGWEKGSADYIINYQDNFAYFYQLRTNEQCYKMINNMFMSRENPSYQAASMIALLLEKNPKMSFDNMKGLFSGLAIEGSCGQLQPNLDRMIKNADNIYIRDVNVLAQNIIINNGVGEIYIDNKKYSDSQFEIPFSNILQVRIGENKGTQLVDLDIVKDKNGILYLDSTFDGVINNTIHVTKGLNKIDKEINEISSIEVKF